MERGTDGTATAVECGMNRYAYILVFAFILCGWRVYSEWRKKRDILRHMSDRPAYSDEEFAEAFFDSAAAPTAAEIHGMLRRYLPYDISRIIPDDRFDEDLQITRFYRTGMVALLMDIEQKFDVALRHRPGIRLKTVGELIRAVARQRTRVSGP